MVSTPKEHSTKSFISVHSSQDGRLSKTQRQSEFSAVKDDLFVSSRSHASDTQIHCIVTLDSRLDGDLFKKSLSYTIRQNPILACRFVNQKNEHAYWQETSELKVDEYLQLVESNEIDAEIHKFLTSPIDVYKGPIFKALIIRSAADVLCFKVSHVLADAGGVKELVGIIADTYSNLQSNAPIKNQTNAIDRSLYPIYKQINFIKKVKIVLYGMRVYINKNYPSKNWALPLKASQQKKKTIIKLHVNKNQFESLKIFCNKNKVTMNDVITAAIFRALHKYIHPTNITPLRIISTVDLRRFYPTNHTGLIANCASLIYINIGRSIGKDIFETTSKVNQAILWQKQGAFGLDFHLFSIKQPAKIPFPVYTIIHRLAKWLSGVINTPSVLPVFTNMGNIENTTVKFGIANAIGAYLTAPIANYPGLIIGMSGFNRSLTITSGFCESVITEDSMQSLFSHISKDIDEIVHWTPVN